MQVLKGTVGREGLELLPGSLGLGLAVDGEVYVVCHSEARRPCRTSGRDPFGRHKWTRSTEEETCEGIVRMKMWVHFVNWEEALYSRFGIK